MISCSDVKQFKNCRLNWHWSSHLREGLHPLDEPDYFGLGTAIHQALQDYHLQGSSLWLGLDQYLPKDYENRPAVLQDLTYIFDLYLEWHTKQPKKRYLQAEDRQVVELPNGIPFTWQYDALIEKADGSQWLIDYKTTKSLPSDLSYLHMNDQAIMYIWGMRQLGYDVKGMIYVFINTKSPTKPKLLKSGKISQAKNIVTTAQCYIDTCKLHDVDSYHGEYDDMLAYIEGRQYRDYFLEVPFIVSPEQLVVKALEIATIAELMMSDKPIIYPNQGKFTCNYCNFQIPCQLFALGNLEAMKNELAVNYERRLYY
jgi:hypothetical protein